MIRGHTEVTAILNRDHPYADLTCFLNCDCHRFGSNNYSQTAVGVNAGYGRRFTQYLPLRPRINQAILKKSDITLKNIGHTMACHPPQVGSDKGVSCEPAVVF